jgi:hypothetical protein
VMHEPEKSDSVVVAEKPTNKAERSVAEPVEPRTETKGNAGQQSTRRAQDRASVSQALERVRQAARQRKKERFTSLLHRRPPKGMNRKFVDSPVRVTEQSHKCFEHEPGQLVLLPAVEFADGMNRVCPQRDRGADHGRVEVGKNGGRTLGRLHQLVEMPHHVDLDRVVGIRRKPGEHFEIKMLRHITTSWRAPSGANQESCARAGVGARGRVRDTGGEVCGGVVEAL